MKKKDSEILSKIGKDTGFKVPENYFENFSAQMLEKLPQRSFDQEIKPSAWTHIKPWVYMAAMFGGIWCMMHIFTDLRDSNPNYNPAIANAFNSESFLDDFVLTTDFNEFSLMEQLYEDSVDFDEITPLDSI